MDKILLRRKQETVTVEMGVKTYGRFKEISSQAAMPEPELISHLMDAALDSVTFEDEADIKDMQHKKLADEDGDAQDRKPDRKKELESLRKELENIDPALTPDVFCKAAFRRMDIEKSPDWNRLKDSYITQHGRKGTRLDIVKADDGLWRDFMNALRKVSGL